LRRRFLARRCRTGRAKAAPLRANKPCGAACRSRRGSLLAPRTPRWGRARRRSRRWLRRECAGSWRRAALDERSSELLHKASVEEKRGGGQVFAPRGRAGRRELVCGAKGMIKPNVQMPVTIVVRSGANAPGAPAAAAPSIAFDAPVVVIGR